MKIIHQIILTFVLTCSIQIVFATAQAPDYLIYKGDTLSIFVNPLESYFDSITRPDDVFYRYGYNSTGCWRGYIAYWELKNDSLFLLEVQGDSCKIDLSLIFKDKQTNKKIFADWVDFPILNPYGKIVNYVHMGYDSMYEFEREFIFKSGILKDIIKYDNSKSKKSIYSIDHKLLKKYIRKNIDYSNITIDPREIATVYVQIEHVSDNGKIDSVKVVRGWDTERDNEAIRVIKSIPDWDVIYNKGERIQIPWTIPVKFGRKNEKK